MKVIVEVKGGMVQNVYSESTDVQVTVLDYDVDYELDDDAKAERDLLEKEIGNMNIVW